MSSTVAGKRTKGFVEDCLGSGRFRKSGPSRGFVDNQTSRSTAGPHRGPRGFAEDDLRKSGTAMPPGQRWKLRIRKVAILLAVVLVGVAVLVADGLRREANEFSAGMENVTGEVTVSRGSKTEAATKGMVLGSRDVVTTGPESTAVVVFPDGSAVLVEPNTEFIIHMMDYERGGKRIYTGMLLSGSVVTRISRFFGAGSRAVISTPTATAAARGTGFRVLYDPVTKQTILQVAHSRVVFTCAGRSVTCSVGKGASAIEYDLRELLTLSAEEMNELKSLLDQLARYDVPVGDLARLERWLMDRADPVLQSVGISPCGVTYARSVQICEEAFYRLCEALENLPALPEHLNSLTLEELGLPAAERQSILSAFAGGRIDFYQKIADGSYALRVRARDRFQTTFEHGMNMAIELPFEEPVLQPGETTTGDADKFPTGAGKGTAGGSGVNLLETITPVNSHTYTFSGGSGAPVVRKPVIKVAGGVQEIGVESPLEAGISTASAPGVAVASALPGEIDMGPFGPAGVPFVPGAMAVMAAPALTSMVGITPDAIPSTISAMSALGATAAAAGLVTALNGNGNDQPKEPAPIIPEPSGLLALAGCIGFITVRRFVWGGT